MTEKEYLASKLNVDEDRTRLSMMETTWDPTTFRHLETIGVAPGWTCLDVGAGYGSITSWLGERVAPNGKIVATDIRPELHRETRVTVEIRQHDILKDELEKNYYDLVHCRALLLHLSETEKALSRMADSVKPGGWLFIEEFDNYSTPNFDSKDPMADLFYRVYRGAAEMADKMRIIDPGYGRRVRSILNNLGFEEVSCEGTMRIVRGGESWAKFHQIEFDRGLRGLKNVQPTEEITQFCQDISKVIELLNNPDFYFISMPLFSAWGKKPSNR